MLDYLNKRVLQLSIKKWVCCLITPLYHYASPPAISNTLGNNPSRNASANIALTQLKP